MKLWGIFDCIVAITILWGGSYAPKKWQQASAFLLFISMMFIGCSIILNSYC